jgi:hypothetical protein
MPLSSRYNALVTSNKGKQAGSAAEVKASFIKQYGQQEGTRRFYRGSTAGGSRRG